MPNWLLRLTVRSLGSHPSPQVFSSFGLPDTASSTPSSSRHEITPESLASSWSSYEVVPPATWAAVTCGIKLRIQRWRIFWPATNLLRPSPPESGSNNRIVSPMALASNKEQGHPVRIHNAFIPFGLSQPKMKLMSQRPGGRSGREGGGW